jgi:hypothetical protein
VSTQPHIQWLSGALSLGIKWPGHEADHWPTSSTKFKEWMELYFHSPICCHGVVLSLKRKHRGNFTFAFYDVTRKYSLSLWCRHKITAKFNIFTYISGEKPGQYQEVLGHQLARLLPNGSLLIEAVAQEDEGHYMCEASNGIGVGLSAVVQLTVQGT